MTAVWGASPSDWAHFDLILGLTEDLLPVVSKLDAVISPMSKMKKVGKTPSLYNGQGLAVGLTGWTAKVSNDADLAKWSKQSDYGICLQTRHVRALDVDVLDQAQADAINTVIVKHLGVLPKRYRSDAPKFLNPILLEGEYLKRNFNTAHGAVEFLGLGQQFIAIGTNPSGVRYEWENGLPSSIPTITPDQFEALWAELVTTFAIEPESRSSAAVKQEVLKNAIHTDPIVTYLADNNFVRGSEKDGRLHIQCPFESEHTGASSDSATTYFPANTGGFARGHFDCKHAHCAARTDEEFKQALGYDDLEFDDLTEEALAEPAELQPVANPTRFAPVHLSQFSEGKAPSWLVKNLIPQAELVVVFGPSGSGKSFMVLDIGAAIAQGIAWRNLRTHKGTVVVIAAEGAGGMRNRAKAYAQHFNVDLADIDMHVIAAAPNFLVKQDALDIVAAVRPLNPVLVIVDTWAQTTAGGNENSGEDMGKALGHCKGIHRATGATVMLVHHSGKNASMGARGWSGLRAAADAELEVNRSDNDRVLSSTKQKDGEDGLEFGFRLLTIPLGIDEDGDIITSCVVEHCEASTMTTKKAINLGDNEKTVLQAAGNLVGLDGTLPDVNSVLDAAVENTPYEHVEGKNDRRKENLKRALKKLIDKNILVEYDGRIEVV